MSKKKMIEEFSENHCGECGWFDDGYCRKTRNSVGFFELACADYKGFDAEGKPATKVCKTCGRELPLSAFGGRHRTADGLQASCKECMSAKIKKSKKAAPAASTPSEAEPIELMPIQEPEVKYEPTCNLDDYTPQELYDELKRRGWSGQLTRTETLQ